MATRGVHFLGQRIHITSQLRADLGIWREFLLQCNRRMCCQGEELVNSSISLFTDVA